MKNTLSSLLLALLSYPAIAQDSVKKYTILNVEAGASFIGLGGVNSTGGSGYTISSGVSVGPTVQLRLIRVTPTWNYGLRAEVAVWVKKDRDVVLLTDDIGNPIGSGDFNIYFAAPAISLAPTVSTNIVKGRKGALAIGLYAGVVFSPHQPSLSSSGNSVSSYLRPSTGFQYGAEINYQYSLSSRLSISTTTGFQRNNMYWNKENAPNGFTTVGSTGFSLNNVPVTAGVSFRL